MYFCFNIQQERQNAYKRNVKVRSRNHFRLGKAISITYFEGVFAALFIQRAKCFRHIILSSAACPAVQYFPTLSLTQRAFSEKFFNIKCVFLFSLQNLSEMLLILRRIKRDGITALRSLCKVRLPYLMKFHFLARFSRSTQILILVKIRPMGTGLFYADRRTDVLRNSASAPENCLFWLDNQFLFRAKTIH